MGVFTVGAEHACYASADQEPVSNRHDISQIETEIEEARVGFRRKPCVTGDGDRVRCGPCFSRECDFRANGAQLG